MGSYTEHINNLTRQYNEAIRALEDSYHMELSSNIHQLTSSHLKRQYSKRYDALMHEYLDKRRQTTNAYKLTHPEWAKARKLWGWIFFAGIMMAMVCCGASLPEEETPATSALAQQQTDAWSAETIEIPYLKDSTQYVANPDKVLSEGTVNRMNITLHRLESELGIQSVVVVVNHIENDDPFRFAQDLGNKYGVGYQNRGLVIVVGYLDHSINMSPGRALEADLTDAECHRLEQKYVVPAMRAEQPDSGMIYLTEAVFATLQKKELPQMSGLMGNDGGIDSETATSIGLTFLFFIAWCVWYLRLNKKYEWLSTLGAVSLLSNPFYESTGRSGGIGGGFGGGGFSSGGGGSFGGGSFGGGSFGGGGATSRW